MTGDETGQPANRRRLPPAALAGWLVPVLVAVDFVRRRSGGLQPTPDGALLRGIAHNLRHHASLTAPTDQWWVMLSPATTWQRLPRVPVPDVAPLYPAVMALVPAPLEVAQWLVNVASLVAALVAVFVLGRRLGTVWTGLAAQVLMVAGPIQQTVFRRHAIQSIAAAETYDVTALSLMLWAFVQSDRRVRFVTLLTAACLTRYAYTAIPMALLAVDLARWGWSRRRPPTLAPAATVVGVALGWQYVLGPLVAGAGDTPKPLGWHPGGLRPLLVALGGWLGLDGQMARRPLALGAALLLVAVVVAVLLLRRCRDRELALRLGVAGSAALAMTVAGKAILVDDLILSDERHLLAVRTTATLLGCAAVTVALTTVLGDRRRTLAARAAAIAAIALVVVSMTDPRLVPRRDSRLAVVGLEEVLAAHRSAALMATSPAWLWDTTGHGAIDVPRVTEPNTGRPRDTDAELAELAEVVDEVVVVRATDDLANLSTVDLRSTCAGLTEEHPFTGGVIEVFDLTGCGAGG